MLGDLARKHEYTRFIQLSYQEAEMDRVATPAILAYRAGDLIANLVSVVDELPADADLNVHSVEHLLQRYNCQP